MAASKPALEFCVLIKFFATIFLALCVQAQGSPNDKAALFVFGDSLFDPGNNKYLNSPLAPSFWPYGETFFNYPTGRYSDGRIIPDFIAYYMKLPFISPYLQPGSNRQFTYGSNFASGGAGALDETNPGIAVSLNTQLNHFKHAQKEIREKLGNVETEKLLSRAIYLLNFGNNDYYVRLENSTKLQGFSRKEYVGMVIGNLTAVIKEIYQSEGRKFGILNLGAFSLTPAAKASFSDVMTEEVGKLGKLHNKALSKALKELKRELKAFEYSEFDFYTSVTEMISSPSKYGFKEVAEACCGLGPYRGNRCGTKGFQVCDNVNDYLFFDRVHPTEHANKLFAEQMWRGSSVVARPTNLKTLVQTR